MRSRILAILALSLAAAVCGQTDTVIVAVGDTPDTLVLTGRIDTTAVVVPDTVISPPDTVVLVFTDTLVTQDTVVVVTVDTVVAGTDTTFLTTVDTLVTVDTVVVVTVDTV